MKEPIKFVCTPHTNASGQLEWPAAAEDRDALASRLFGACIVQAMDYWVGETLDQLGKMVELTPDQRDRLERLVAGAVRGTVFSLLVKMDQFPGGLLDLGVSDSDTEQRLANVTEGDIFDLHDRLHGWVAEFSEHARLYVSTGF